MFKCTFWQEVLIDLAVSSEYTLDTILGIIVVVINVTFGEFGGRIMLFSRLYEDPSLAETFGSCSARISSLFVSAGYFDRGVKHKIEQDIIETKSEVV